MSFFVAGGTVPPGSPSYVERSADRELYEALLAGEFCYVLNSRQMGKSSLAVRTMGKLNEAGVRTAFLDLTRIGAAGAEPGQWYAGLLLELGRALGLRAEAAALLREGGQDTPSGRFFRFFSDVVLTRIEGPVAVFIDEVDATRSLPFSADDLFAGIRQAWNARAEDPRYGRLTFCLMGAALPSDLIRDVRMTPFNVGRRIELRDFTESEATAFAGGLGEAGEAMVRQVVHWTGGHPYLTQAICRELAQEGSQDLDALVRHRYLDERARDTDSNLSDAGNRLLGTGDPDVDDQVRADTLSLYEAMLKGKPVADDEATPAAARIKMSGVARTESGGLKPRNRIYAQTFDRAWVRENMPGQELRRQRRAFRRGVLRTGIMASAVVAMVGGLAWKNALLAIEARKSEERAVANERVTSRNLYESQIAQAGKELFEGSLINVERYLAATKDSPSRNLEWWLIEGQTRRGLRRLPAGTLSRDVLFSRDGSTLWANDQYVLHQFDTRTWKEVRTLITPLEETAMNGIALDERRGLVAAPTDSGQIAVWSLSLTAKPRLLEAAYSLSGGWNGRASALSAAWSPDGAWLVAGSANSSAEDETIFVYRTSDWKCVKRISIPGNVQSLRFSPDGRTLAAADWTIHGGKGGGISWIDVETWKPLHRVIASSEGVPRVAWSPDGRLLAGCTSEGNVLLYDETRSLARTLSAQTVLTKAVIEFHPQDGETFAQTKRSRIGTEDALFSVAFSRDGKRILAGAMDGSASVWDVATGRILRHDRIKSAALWDATTSPDALVAYAGVGSDGIVVQDVNPRSTATELSGPKNAIFGLCASPSGRYLAAADWNETLWVWDLEDGFRAKRYPYAGRATDARWTAEDTVALLVYPGTVQRIRVNDAAGPATSPASVPAWLVKDGADRESWKGISDTAAVNREGWIAERVGKTIRVLDPRTHQSVQAFPINSSDSIVWGRDQRLIVADINEIVVFDRRTWQSRRLRGHTNWISAVGESPDGSRIMSAADDGTARIWSVETGECLLAIPHPANLRAALILPRNDYLATVGGDLKIRLWPMKRTGVSEEGQMRNAQQSGKE